MLRKKMLFISVGVAVVMSLLHFYTGFFGVFDVVLQRGFHLLGAVLLVFLCFPLLGKKKGDTKWSIWIDVVLVICSIVVFGYVLVNYKELGLRYGLTSPVSTLEIILGIAAILLIAEACRRVQCWPLAILALISAVYIVYGNYFPGMFEHRGWKIEHLIHTVYLSRDGIYGIPLGTSATYAALFILLGSFLQEAGLGKFILDFASIIAGRSRGGPAKIAVVASGFFGMITGGAVANVYTTGTFTIPLMKKINYKPHFAAATEAVASTGGAILPPIMGAIAFVMADMTGIAYIDIVKAAIIPGILYYVAIIAMVHFEAHKTGLRGLTLEEIPLASQVYNNLHLAIPPIILVYILMSGFTPFRAASVTIVASIIIAAIKLETRIGLTRCISALEKAAKNMVVFAVATAAAGIVLSSINISGIGIKFTSFALRYSADANILVPLFITMVVCLVLGMGLPGVPAYLIVSALAIPVLRDAGLSVMQAHFFAVYFAVLSTITPPVAVATFAAASIAESDINKTAITAVKLAAAGFIIPFIFALDPTILGVGTFMEVSIGAVTALIGVITLGAALQGWFLNKVNIIGRMLLLAGAISLMFPGASSDLTGIAIVLAVLFIPAAIRKFRNTPNTTNV